MLFRSNDPLRKTAVCVNLPVLKACDIHGLVHWPKVLEALGFDEHTLNTHKHGPCPACGGKDRFRFTNHKSRGGFYCSQCGPGDGFALLERVYGWTFSEARRRVIEAAGLGAQPATVVQLPRHTAEPTAHPTRRVLQIRREACAVEHCDDARDYLASRGLWPLPDRHALRAHASCEYWDSSGQGPVRIGRFAALVTEILDSDNELATLHVTYLQAGRKLEGHEPRKLLSPLTGRTGCAVRLMPLAGEAMGIAEGIETALSAAKLHRVPTWAALNTALLAKFEPPPQVRRLVIFADRDEAGLSAAADLAERMQGRCAFEIRRPVGRFKDFNDELAGRR